MQIAYVNAYEGNATQAAIQAGYSASSARQSAARLMSKAAIRDAIAARQALDSQQLQIGRQEAIQGLLLAIADAKAQGNPAAMISGWREIGRMLGFYEPDRAEVAVTVGELDGRQRLEAMTDAELISLIEGGN